MVDASHGLLRLPHLTLQDARSQHKASSSSVAAGVDRLMLMSMSLRSCVMFDSQVVGGCPRLRLAGVSASSSACLAGTSGSSRMRCPSHDRRLCVIISLQGWHFVVS